MKSWTKTLKVGCVITALGFLLVGGTGCKLDDAVVDGVESGLSDVVSGTLSEVVLGLLGID